MKPLLIIAALIGRDWTGTEKPARAEPQIVEIIVEKIIEPEPPVEWSIDELAEPDKLQWLVFTAKWCSFCQAADKDLAKLIEREWRVSDDEDAHIRKIDSDTFPELLMAYQVEKLPTFVLVRNGVELKRHTKHPGHKQIAEEYVAESASRMKAWTDIQAGTIDGNTLKFALTMIGERGSIRLGNTAFTHSMGAASATFPANFSADWSTTNGKTVMKFATKPKLKFSLLEQSIDGLTWDGKQLSINIPWAPDLVLGVK